VRRRIFAIVALATAYVVTARVGLALDAVAGFATLVWAPSGIALAALLQGGRPLWPGVFVGAFIANVWVGASPVVAGGIAAGNTLEAVAGAALLLRLSFDARLERIADVARLLVVALASTTVSATVGVASLLAGGVVHANELVQTWRAWWVGDAIGDVIVAPLLLVWSVARGRRLASSRLAEGGLAVGASVATCYSVFGPAAIGVHFIFAPLIWAAVRLGQRGCTLMVVAVSVCAIAGTASGHGPFAYTQLSRSLLDLQSFMGFVATVTMMLAAAIADRDHARALAVGALKGRDDFLAIASHELRTPLSALALQLGTMRRLLAKGDALADDRVQRAERQTDRLTHLVTRLLDVSRIEAGQLRIQPEPLDLEVLVRDVTDRMTEEAAGGGAALRIQTSGPITGSWDRLRLEQVLSNLLSNAFRYAPGRPVDVTLEEGRRERAPGERRVVRLAVRDHGPGVPGGRLEELFTPYQRGNAARERGGLGLGLYISRHLVEAHGGTLTGRSEPGAGCEFVVELPLDAGYHGSDVQSAQGEGARPRRG
jgi:signal transduction histidine kinase